MCHEFFNERLKALLYFSGPLLIQISIYFGRRRSLWKLKGRLWLEKHTVWLPQFAVCLWISFNCLCVLCFVFTFSTWKQLCSLCKIQQTKLFLKWPVSLRVSVQFPSWVTNKNKITYWMIFLEKYVLIGSCAPSCFPRWQYHETILVSIQSKADHRWQVDFIREEVN